jgi:hypothetical protein
MTSRGRAVQRGAIYVLRFKTATPNKANETENITVPPAMVKPMLSRVVMVVHCLSYFQNQKTLYRLSFRSRIMNDDDKIRKFVDKLRREL